VSTRSGRDSLVLRVRLSGAVLAVVALGALAAIGPPGTARAVTTTGSGYDQISGIGSTDSAITVPWTQGLLDNNNQPIASANAIRSSPAGPLSFMYNDPDFRNLQVTVSQTQDITHQGITVSWSGALPTVTGTAGVGSLAENYMQLMECYGDSSSGPSPQDCEYGTGSQLGGGLTSNVGTRSGDLCAVDSNGNTLPPSTSSPPASLNGDTEFYGCDPEEPLQGASPADIDPADPQQYTIPFVPTGGCGTETGCPAYGTIDTNQYFNEFNTNEVEGAITSSNGTGQVQFETLTNTQAPGLGCGQLESNGQPQNCWLVIVPRGEYEPNGWEINANLGGAAGFLVSSPLSASNWAMRIQIHLDYAPLQAFCPIGTNETETVGTQVIERAVQSWQLALNNAAHCSTIYGYSAVPEATSTQQLAASGSGVGLAFTTIPIGSEADRPGGSGGTVNLPPLVYAPVAVSAVGFGFDISQKSGYVTTPVKLSPEVLAKALTQVYLYDLPDYYPNPTVPGISPDLGPSWAAGNPENITQDGQFLRMNPELSFVPTTVSLAPLLTEDHSALNQQIWEWIQADPGAVAWLNQGTPDITNFDTVTADPDYTALQLGTPPAIDSFPRAYSTCLEAGVDETVTPPKEISRCSLDLLPYVANYDTAAANILSGYNPVITNWNSQDIAPDGTNGWWDTNPPEPLGSRWVWGISDTADLAAYGVIDAQLCDDAGNNCVAPSTASLTAALDSAKPDSAGLLEVDPADPGSGGYPLTEVIYAAVATNQSAADLTADADLIAYAAGTGQTAGVAPGDLPPGYLPMSASLQAQAMSVVAQLRADAGVSTSPSAATSAGSGTGTGSAGGTGSASIPGQPLSSATPGAGPSISPPSAQLAATVTQPQPVGTVRWVLLFVFTAGVACAVGGTVLRSARVPRWLRRMRP
jgi:hypothetical protein